MNIFTYGTLMSLKIWERVVMGKYLFQPGILQGYTCNKVKNEVYPGLIKSKTTTVKGVIYWDVNREDILRLDQFEGDEYKRIIVKIKDPGNKEFVCQTYLVKDEFNHKITEVPWSFNYFVNQDFDKFVGRYKGWHTIRH